MILCHLVRCGPAKFRSVNSSTVLYRPERRLKSLRYFLSLRSLVFYPVAYGSARCPVV
jgi:hypothetical protein